MAKPQDSPRSDSSAKQNKEKTMASNSFYFAECGPWGPWTKNPRADGYFRARHVPQDAIASIPITSRSSIVLDRNEYIHYEFVSFDEFMDQYYPQPAAPQMVSAAPEPVAPPTSVEPQQSQQEEPVQEEVQEQKQKYQNSSVPEVDDYAKTGYMSGADGTGNGVRIIELETTKHGISLNIPNISQGRTILLDKRTRKKIKADAKKKVHHRSKVDAWMDQPYRRY